MTSLLNFAPRVLSVPAHVHLRYVDLSIELQVLGFYRARQDEPVDGRPKATGCPSCGRWACPPDRPSTWPDLGDWHRAPRDRHA